MAVGLSEDDLGPYMQKVHSSLSGELVICCYNSPSNITVSGDEAKIDALKALLDADSVFARKLAVPNAYHSSHMTAMADVYWRLLGNIKSTDKLASLQDVHIFSSVTGQLVDSDLLESAQYWVDNLVSPVNFTKSLTVMCFQSLSKGQKSVSMNNTVENVFLNDIVEVGPHGALQSAIKQTIKTYNTVASIGYLPALDHKAPGVRIILTVAGYLNSRGYSVKIRDVNKTSGSIHPQMLVSLPPYRFDHSNRIWYEGRITKNLRLRKHPKHDLFGAPVADWNAEEPRWRYIMRLSENPWLKDLSRVVTYTPALDT